MSDIAGKGCEQLIPFSDRKSLQEIERSIITTYRKDIWSKFIKAIKEFQLIEDGDKIAVAISGGKDSLLMAKLFQELKRHGRDNFQLEFVAMDPGYHDSIKQLLVDNCQHLDIPVHIFDSGIFRIVDNVAKDYPCYMCAKMRRGALYRKAQELGCNKLALGHHFNDVIETTMLNLLYTGNFSTMLPKLKSSNFEGLELIRPLYHIEEEAIIDFTDHSGIWPLNCACMVAAKKIGTKRYEVKALIKELKTKFESVDKSIFRAAQNVNMEAILGWQKDGKNYSYLEEYD
ncbi:tRNA 2-thiocytidine biosynthesis TtcA family protein [Clostridium formicaceticum]|uniref:tRNA 2-thiocytidine biosynthesis protein TtcA n=1 Tax=Clostridium formicaceticum TaxID=1497 RepID=A0AAC9RPH0_9CLOT|nr:ATP-binding protein [Clostridium formicaceticum]AOY77975.1 tRNA 2-thiocytidine(32) synthetase TtcA [Clostridium formicaceticum]ARE88598.1 tRNA 2-thiocytidine biosynthesis protein TtcA [Clostridium formicaceticum]